MPRHRDVRPARLGELRPRRSHPPAGHPAPPTPGSTCRSGWPTARCGRSTRCSTPWHSCWSSPAPGSPRSQVLDLLGSGPVRRRFRLDDDDLERLRDLVVRSGVRWGLDGPHRAPFHLDGFAQNTWSAGLDRLLLGVTMAGDARVRAGHGSAPPCRWRTSTPATSNGSGGWPSSSPGSPRCSARSPGSSRWSAGWTRWSRASICSPMSRAATSGRPCRPAASWRRPSRAAGPHAAAVPLELGDVRGLLTERLRGRPPARTSAPAPSPSPRWCRCGRCRTGWSACSGSTTACSPRAGVPDGDDLLARDPLVGERDPRSEDRQLLLDAICAATEHLVVVHSGADERTGARRPPAVPLGELLDAIEATAGPAARAQVVVRHPLQPFDARNFAAGELGPGPFSFDRAELAGARAATGPKSPPGPFLAEPLAPVDARRGRPGRPRHVRGAPGQGVPPPARRALALRRRGRPWRRAPRRPRRARHVVDRRPAAARPAGRPRPGPVPPGRVAPGRAATGGAGRRCARPRARRRRAAGRGRAAVPHRRGGRP